MKYLYIKRMLFLWAILIANFLNGDKLWALRGEEPQVKGSFSSHVSFAFFLARSLSASSETPQPLPSGAGCHSSQGALTRDRGDDRIQMLWLEARGGGGAEESRSG